MPGTKRNLLRLREEVVRIAVERELADHLERHQFFGNQLGRIEQVEVELVFVLFLDDLHAECPFWIVAVVDPSHRSRR